MKRSRWVLATVSACALALAFLSCAKAAAEQAPGEIIERIVAVVNGEALLLSELRRRAAPFLPRLMQAPELQRMTLMEQLYDELLGQLIDERLLEQESRKLSVTVAASEIDRAVDNLQRQNELDDADFWEAVEAQGMSRKEYRAELRRQLLRLKVINQKVRTRINVTDDDVRHKYDEMVRSALKSAHFEVSHIFLPVPADSATKLAAAKKEAEEIRGQLTTLNFSDAIAEHGGRDLGWVQQKDLPSALAEALAELEPGQISEPVRGPSGVHIFWLRDRKQDGVPTYASVKDDLYRQIVDQSLEKQELAYLSELRKQSLISRRL